jgi:hypothetical protein
LLTAGACLQVSISSDFPIWTIAWIPTLPSFIPKSKFPNNKEQPVGSISDFIQIGTNQWNLNALASVFDNVLVLEISKIHISLNTQTSYL